MILAVIIEIVCIMSKRKGKKMHFCAVLTVGVGPYVNAAADKLIYTDNPRIRMPKINCHICHAYYISITNGGGLLVGRLSYN